MFASGHFVFMLINHFPMVEFGKKNPGDSEVPYIDIKPKNVLLQFFEVRPFVFVYLPD